MATNNKLDKTGLGRAWDRVFSLVKLLTGDVDVAGKGTLQGQIDELNRNLDTKASSEHTHDNRYYTETEIDTKLSAKASLATPIFTGAPKAPTPVSGANNTQIATTAFVRTELDSYCAGALATEIPENANLNTYKTFGNYVSPNAERSKTLLNCPYTDAGFVLRVERVTGAVDGTYFRQTLTCNHYRCMEFTRNYFDGTWGKWIQNDEWLYRLVPYMNEILLNGMLISIADPLGPYNYAYKVTSDGGSNMPPGLTKGIRYVDYYDGTHIMIRFHEIEPFYGRMWFNMYNGTTWSGWKKSFIPSPSSGVSQIQAGDVTIEATANKITDVKVTFPEAFPNIPKVVTGIFSSTTDVAYGNISVMVSNVTKTGFTARVANLHSANLAPNIQWIAASV